MKLRMLPNEMEGNNKTDTTSLSGHDNRILAHPKKKKKKKKNRQKAQKPTAGLACEELHQC
jgi:hypothetical protein